MAIRLAVFELKGGTEDRQTLHTVDSLVSKGGRVVIREGRAVGAVRLPRLPQFSKNSIVVMLP
jgi:hypothetical protein